MKLEKILPDIIKEVVKQTLESIMIAEREVFTRRNEERLYKRRNISLSE